MPVVNCIVNDAGQRHAIHAENADSVHDTCLDKIIFYSQRIFKELVIETTSK